MEKGLYELQPWLHDLIFLFLFLFLFQFLSPPQEKNKVGKKLSVRRRMSSCLYSHVTPALVIADESHRKSLTLNHGFPTTSRRSSVTFPMNNSLSFPLLKIPMSQSSHHSPTDGREEDPESVVESLRIPDEWLIPSRAIEESEWLRETLHKWLDDEYCPEPTNIEISKVAAKSYYTSLLQKETDMGEILLKMAQDLTSISYQESFHGAFTSANAAINLILNRIETDLE